MKVSACPVWQSCCKATASCTALHNKPPTTQELWTLLASASSNPSGIPQKILDEKAEEMRQKKVMEEEINVNPSAVPAGPLPTAKIPAHREATRSLKPTSML